MRDVRPQTNLMHAEEVAPPCQYKSRLLSSCLLNCLNLLDLVNDLRAQTTSVCSVEPTL